MNEKWFTVGEVAAMLHVQRMTAWRLLRPYRDRCHLGRAGSHPRRVLWVPVAVVEELRASRSRWWRERASGFEPAPESA
jgi:hypothetical protein